jgi:pimeloyl-ACP methyl ester carboxylesterase
MNTKIVRIREWSRPPTPVRREVRSAKPAAEGGQPVLFVPGYGHGAWAYAEHWLGHAAARGFDSYTMSLRGHGTSGADPNARLTDYVHDVTQVAVSLPKQAVLVGHGAGALVVAQAMARYPVRAGVLVAPVFGGIGMAFDLLRRDPIGTLPGLFGGSVRFKPGRLFSPDLPAETARDYAKRLDKVPGGAQRELIRRHEPESPVGDPPVLVLGSPDDRIVPAKSLERTAQIYGGAPLLFPGMGHDLMLDARWQEPIDAILDWVEKA